MTLAPKTGTFNLNERFIALEKRVAQLEDIVLRRQSFVIEEDLSHEAPKELIKSKYSAAFTAFWSEYPRKIGKGAAWKVWKREKLDKLVEVIVQSVKDHLELDEQWTKDGGQFIPHPSTFLNQSRWEDEFDNKEDGGEW